MWAADNPLIYTAEADFVGTHTVTHSVTDAR
ncbi:hypothetical protein FHY30_003526 [Xanthomonas arboricola]|nr:hypothetical protein [Xanthomonas campestris]MCW2036101.1 hypothetical protein [Xanthomonas campestris]